MLGVLRGGGSVHDVNDAYASKVGGAPTYFAPVAADHGKCDNCNEGLVMVCQLYAPIPGLHRSLIVYSCPTCGPAATWKVLRSQQVEALLSVDDAGNGTASADSNDASSSIASFSAPTPPPLAATPDIKPDTSTSSAWEVTDDWGADSDSDDAVDNNDKDNVNESTLSNAVNDVGGSRQIEEAGLDEITEMLKQRDLLGERLSANAEGQQSSKASAVSQSKKLGPLCRPLDIVDHYVGVTNNKSTSLS
jgi:hypothetical protein